LDRGKGVEAFEVEVEYEYVFRCLKHEHPMLNFYAKINLPNLDVQFAKLDE
jgi:hypothetical protein